jgi:hypothetical protein
MMKKYCIVMLLGCLLFGSGAKAALFSTTDLLNGDGGFEFAGGAGPWTPWSGNGSEPAGVVAFTWTPDPGLYSYKLGGTSATAKNIRAQMTVNGMVTNRNYQVEAYARSTGSSPSWARINLGSGAIGSAPSVALATSMTKNTLSYLYSEASTTAALTLAEYSNSANDGMIFDNIKLFREIVLPNVDSYTGSGTAWTLSNAGGRIGANLQLVAFDPTVTVSYVSGFNVGNIAATWSNDNQLLLSFQNSLAGAVDLQITNPYGNASYTVTMVPEPATISILGLGLLGLIRSRSRK